MNKLCPIRYEYSHWNDHGVFHKAIPLTQSSQRDPDLIELSEYENIYDYRCYEKQRY